MAHYLLTGVAGFIASHVAGMLLKGGHNVYGVDNMNDAYDVRIKEYRLANLQGHPGFTYSQMDIEDRAAVQALGEDNPPFDGVINLAARAGVRASIDDPWIYYSTNVNGTLNLLELCRHQGIPKFVLASSSSVYSSNAPLPTPEDADTSQPLQPYAASKKAAEVLCHAYHSFHGLDVTVFRYFTVYGPAGRPDMVMFRFIQWLSEGRTVYVNGDGEQTRGFTFVDDIARGTILGLKPVGYQIINLGGHQSVSINELIVDLEKRIGQEAQIEYRPPHEADLQANWANVEKAGRILGWEPEVSFDDGVDATLAWYQAEREWVSQIDTSD